MSSIIKLRNRNGNIIPIPAVQGAPGVSNFIHIKFKEAVDSTELLDTTSDYIGISVTGTPEAPTSAASYKWIYARGETGLTGEAGVRGSRWNNGTSVTGTSTTPNIFATGIQDSLSNDLYLNTDNGNLYLCTLGGDASTALWAYLFNAQGVEGPVGPSSAVISETEPDDPDVQIWIQPDNSPDPFLLYEVQDLTITEKAQARHNIDAASSKRCHLLPGTQADIYTLTTTQPGDWSDNYTDYYTVSGDTYTAVTGASAPTWASDTYYSKTSNLEYRPISDFAYIISTPITEQITIVLPSVDDYALEQNMIIYATCQSIKPIKFDMLDTGYSYKNNVEPVLTLGYFKVLCELNPFMQKWVVSIEECGERAYEVPPAIVNEIISIENI